MTRAEITPQVRRDRRLRRGREVPRHPGEALLERDVRPARVRGRGPPRAGDPARRRGARGRRRGVPEEVPGQDERGRPRRPDDRPREPQPRRDRAAVHAGDLDGQRADRRQRIGRRRGRALQHELCRGLDRSFRGERGSRRRDGRPRLVRGPERLRGDDAAARDGRGCRAEHPDERAGTDHPARGRNFSVWSPTGILLVSVDTGQLGQELETWEPGERTLTIRLGKVPFLPGAHRVDLWVQAPGGHLYAHVEDAIAFEIGQSPLYGTSYIDRGFGCVFTSVEVSASEPAATTGASAGRPAGPTVDAVVSGHG